MKIVKYAILVLFIFVCGVQVQAQNDKQIKNLPGFDFPYYHFGFVLSLNTSNLIVKFKDITNFSDSVLSINSQSQPGFNLAMLASLDFTGNWHLRFIPTLSFEERILEYNFLLENGKIETLNKTVSSTNIDFPLLIKYRTNRMNNVAVYALAGGQFSLDVASKKNVNNNNAKDIVIKLDNINYSGVIGLGLDFFLPYFKFGLELKTNIGIKNIFIDDQTKFSDPIKSIRSQSLVLSLTFEG